MSNISATVSTISSADKALDDLLVPYYFVAGYILPVIVFVGLIDNVIVLAAFSSRKIELGASVRLYYMTLAGLDVICLLIKYLFNDYLSDGLSYILPYEDPLLKYVYSNVGCKFATFAGSAAEYSGNWIYVFLSLERLFFILFPMKARRVVTLRFSACCIGFIVLACSLESVVYALYYSEGLLGTAPVCNYLAPDPGSITSTYAILSAYLVAPIVNMVICSVILTQLKAAHAKRAEMGHTSSVSGIQTTLILLIISSIHSVFNAVYGVTRCVWFVNRVYNFLPSFEGSRVKVAYNFIAAMMLSLNHSTNFFVYYFCMKQMRTCMCRRKS